MAAADASPSLNVLSSRRLPQPIRFPFTSYSHKHDLLAIVVGPAAGDSTWEVQVFRILSGQLAFAIRRADAAFAEETIEVTSLAWKPDGLSLSVGWSDGKYGIYDGGTGRQLWLADLADDSSKEEFALDLKLPARRSATDGDAGSNGRYVAVLGFMEHHVPSYTHKALKRTVSYGISSDDWYDDLEQESKILHPFETESATKLPRAIAALDVTTILPRLSAIPSHGLVQPKSGAGASKFGTQAAVDTQFDDQKGLGSGTVQSLLVCPCNGVVQVLVDDAFKVGAVTSTTKPIAHAAHEDVSTHAVLCEGEAHSDAMRMTFLDLPLSTLNGSLLHAIATNIKRVQTLLDYIVQTARCIQFDYSTNVAVPLRFINVLAMDMESKHPNDGDALANLYHLAMTGSFHPQVLEWIVDIIKDTNIRRWETHMNAMYSNVHGHLFMNLLPALDRFSIALAALRAQAAYHEESSSFECSPKYFDALLENVDSIRLVAQSMQLIIQSEHRQFRAFIRWLKMQVDIAVAEPFTQNAMETEEREVPNIDFALMLTYIKENMLRSKLAVFIENRPTAKEGATRSIADFLEEPHIRDMSYRRTQQVLDQLNQGKNFSLSDVADPDSLINLSALVCGLIGRTSIAVRHVTAWQTRLVFPPTDPPSITLSMWSSEVKVLDMKMVSMGKDDYITRVLGIDSGGSGEVHILSVTATSKQALTTSGHDSKSTRRQRRWMPQTCSVSLGPESQCKVIDSKFVPHAASGIISLCQANETQTTVLVMSDEDPPPKEPRILHQFPQDNHFRPERIAIGGRPGKLLCVVFGNKEREWRVLDLATGLQRRLPALSGEEMEVV